MMAKQSQASASQDDPKAPAVERMALRIKEVAAALGFTVRTLNRLRSAGKFPPPDRRAGRMPLWMPSTVRAWADGGGRR